MNNHVEQIKERLSIVDVISSYIKLEKAGVNYKARCPFHNEKTPSFMVSPVRNTFYCFGCGAKGDAFSFVEQFEGTDFKGALQTLAGRAGVELAPINQKAEDERSRLFALLEDATVHFEELLKNTKEAQNYLKKRGVSKESIEVWRIGYAKDSWDDLVTTLKNKNYTEKEILDAGLIKPSPKGRGHYDRFRGRIIFPIMDSSGRVIAYTGRILPLPSNSEFKDDTAKYLNSPETKLYEKSHVLYGYHIAKNSIRKNQFSILTEGQMDVVLSHQAGYANTIAASGTALTANQLKLLSRLSNNLVMAFDADTAGIRAGGKGIDLALLDGMDVKVATLPFGKDPADLITEGVGQWKKVIREAKHVVEFYLDHVIEKHEDARKRRVEVGQVVIPYIAQIPNKLDQAHFVNLVATKLGLQETPIWDSVREAAQKSTQNGVGQATEHTEPKETESQTELSRHHAIQDRLVGVLLWQEGLKKPKKNRAVDVKKLRSDMEHILGKEIFGRRLEHTQHMDDAAVFKVEQLYATSENLQEEVDHLVEELTRENLKHKYVCALENLKEAEESGDEVAIQKALSECRTLSEALGT